MSNTPIADKVIQWIIYGSKKPETGKEYFERKLKEKQLELQNEQNQRPVGVK